MCTTNVKTVTIVVIVTMVLSARGVDSRHTVEATKRDAAGYTETTTSVNAKAPRAEPNDNTLSLPERWDGGGPMEDALLYLTERSRAMFKDDCLNGKMACTYDEIGANGKYRWNSQLHDDAKIRFWKVYECTLTKKNNECPIDGGWSVWSSWNACSVTCGQGVRFRDRKCDNPVPKNNGFKCSGLTKQQRLCHGACIPAYEDVTKLGPPKQEAYSILKATHAEHPVLKSNCYIKHCTYRSVKNIIDKSAADAYWSALHCFKYGNACPIDGNWSEWTGWEQCTAACNEGIKVRTRKCNSPAPTGNGNWCEGEAIEREPCKIRSCESSETAQWKEWQTWSQCTKTCEGGVSVRRRECEGGSGKCEGEESQTSPCETQRCSLKGQWASWGTWNACSRQCGLGVSLRDRTCSNPIPSGRGNICKGPGTEAAYCYKTPCNPHSENVAVFSGNSYIEYSGPLTEASRTLVVYIRFRPNSNAGILYQSFNKPDECKKLSKPCSNKVILKLSNGLVVLDSKMGDAKLTISSTVKVLSKKWNTVFLTLAGQIGTLTLNDKHYYSSKYSKEPSPDYNMPTLVGVGFKGAVSKLRINFRDVSLQRIDNWEGYGSPVNLEHVDFKPADIEATLPEFNGNTYSYIDHFDDRINNHSIQSKVIIKPKEGLDGYIFYNEGLIKGSFVYLQYHEAALKFCITPGSKIKETCALGETISPEKWYLVECIIEGYEIEIKINNNQPGQATFTGQPYRPKPYWYIGGIPLEKKKTLILETAGRNTHGYKGYIDAVIVGDTFYGMREAALISSDGYVNAVGASYAERFKDLYELSASIVMLRCNYSAYVASNNGRPIHVTWLKGTQRIRFDKFVNLEPDSPADKHVSVLKIDPPAGSAHEYEGSYECMIFAKNQRFILNAYGLSFKDKHLDLEEEIVDKAEISITVIAILFGAISVVAFAIGLFLTLRARNKKAKKESFKGAFERFADEIATADESEHLNNNAEEEEALSGSSLMSLARAAIKKDYYTPIPSGLSIGLYAPNRNINMSQRRSNDSVNRVTSQGISKFGMGNRGLHDTGAQPVSRIPIKAKISESLIN